MPLSNDIFAENRAVGTCSKQQPPTSLLPWEICPDSLHSDVFIDWISCYSPEMISRYLAYKILHRLWIANRQANGDSAFQVSNLFVPKVVSLLHFPIKFATPGCYSSQRLESGHLSWQNGAIRSLYISRTTNTAGQLLDLCIDLSSSVGKPWAFSFKIHISTFSSLQNGR